MFNAQAGAACTVVRAPGTLKLKREVHYGPEEA